jgi:hypothetical protein
MDSGEGIQRDFSGRLEKERLIQYITRQLYVAEENLLKLKGAIVELIKLDYVEMTEQKTGSNDEKDDKGLV